MEKKTDEAKDKDFIYLSSKHIWIAAIVIATVLIFVGSYLVIKKNSDSCQGDICEGNPVLNNQDVVAEVNGQQITNEQFNKEIDMILFLQGMPAEYKNMIPEEQLLNQTILMALLYQEATKQGYSIDREEVQNLLAQSLVNNDMDLTEFKKVLENKSINYDELIDLNAKQRVINKFLNDTVYEGILVNDDEALKYYNANKDKLIVPEQVNVSHILVNTSAEAEQIIKRLDNGEDFTDIAKEESLDNTINLGYIREGMTVQEFENASFALKKAGDYTEEPVKTQYGYHVILLNGREEERQLDFSEIKDQLKQLLLSQEQSDRLKAYITQLMAKSDIKNYLTG
jgi:parvulin-like peptidyl-prolyl isomerase